MKKILIDTFKIDDKFYKLGDLKSWYNSCWKLFCWKNGAFIKIQRGVILDVLVVLSHVRGDARSYEEYY